MPAVLSCRQQQHLQQGRQVAGGDDTPPSVQLHRTPLLQLCLELRSARLRIHSVCHQIILSPVSILEEPEACTILPLFRLGGRKTFKHAVVQKRRMCVWQSMASAFCLVLQLQGMNVERCNLCHHTLQCSERDVMSRLQALPELSPGAPKRYAAEPRPCRWWKVLSRCLPPPRHPPLGSEWPSCARQ